MYQLYSTCSVHIWWKCVVSQRLVSSSPALHWKSCVFFVYKFSGYTTFEVCSLIVLVDGHYWCVKLLPQYYPHFEHTFSLLVKKDCRSLWSCVTRKQNIRILINFLRTDFLDCTVDWLNTRYWCAMFRDISFFGARKNCSRSLWRLLSI